MKLTARDLSSFLANPAQYRSVLLYGPDEGQVRERKKQILAQLLGTNPDPASIRDLEESAILDDPASLADALAAFSLLADKTVVTLRLSGEKAAKIIEEALQLPSSQNFLLVSAGDLPPRSAVRKGFESSKAAAALGCYADEARTIEQMLRGEFSKRQIASEQGVIPYLASRLGNDRAVTLAEIEKIDLFLGNERTLSLAQTEALVGDNDTIASDDLCMAIATGQGSKALTICARLCREGAYPVSLLRSIIYYFERIFTTQSHLGAGKPLDEALNTLHPPVFFKYKASFSAQVRNLRPLRVKQMLRLLVLTERRLKRTSDPETLLFSVILRSAYLAH